MDNSLSRGDFTPHTYSVVHLLQPYRSSIRQAVTCNLCRASKLPSKLQGYVLSSNKPASGSSNAVAQHDKTAAVKPNSHKMHARTHNAPSSKPPGPMRILRLNVKFNGHSKPRQPMADAKQCSQEQMQSRFLCKPADEHHHAPAATPRASCTSSKTGTAEAARKFNIAPVERPATRRFMQQQTAKVRVSIKLREVAMSKCPHERSSTLTHQQKRHGQTLPNGRVKQQNPQPIAAHDAHTASSHDPKQGTPVAMPVNKGHLLLEGKGTSRISVVAGPAAATADTGVQHHSHTASVADKNSNCTADRAPDETAVPAGKLILAALVLYDTSFAYITTVTSCSRKNLQSIQPLLL